MKRCKKETALKLKKFKKGESGQAMVEFALVLPVLLLIIFGMLDFGWYFYNQLSLDNCCREGARYAVVNSTDSSSEAVIKSHIRNTTKSVFYLKDEDIDIVYTNPSDKLSGDVIVTLTTNMKILTPVLGFIVGKQDKDISSTVQMKVES